MRWKFIGKYWWRIIDVHLGQPRSSTRPISVLIIIFLYRLAKPERAIHSILIGTTSNALMYMPKLLVLYPPYPSQYLGLLRPTAIDLGLFIRLHARFDLPKLISRSKSSCSFIYAVFLSIHTSFFFSLSPFYVPLISFLLCVRFLYGCCWTVSCVMADRIY